MSEKKKKLEVWMRFGQPLEAVMGDFERTFDAWETMGVRGIILGRMYFRDDDHEYHPIFEPNAKIYKRLGVPTPDRPAKMFPERRRQLDRLFADVKKRKLRVIATKGEAIQKVIADALSGAKPAVVAKAQEYINAKID